MLENIKLHNLTKIAWAMFDAHGENAFEIANKAMLELEDEGYPNAANAWRGVISLIEDAKFGRIDRQVPVIN